MTYARKDVLENAEGIWTVICVHQNGGKGRPLAFTILNRDTQMAFFRTDTELRDGGFRRKDDGGNNSDGKLSI